MSAWELASLLTADASLIVIVVAWLLKSIMFSSSVVFGSYQTDPGASHPSGPYECQKWFVCSLGNQRQIAIRYEIWPTDMWLGVQIRDTTTDKCTRGVTIGSFLLSRDAKRQEMMKMKYGDVYLGCSGCLPEGFWGSGTDRVVNVKAVILYGFSPSATSGWSNIIV